MKVRRRIARLHLCDATLDDVGMRVAECVGEPSFAIGVGNRGGTVLLQEVDPFERPRLFLRRTPADRTDDRQLLDAVREIERQRLGYRAAERETRYATLRHARLVQDLHGIA